MEKTKGISFKVVLAIIIAVIVILAIIFVVAKNKSNETNDRLEKMAKEEEIIQNIRNAFDAGREEFVVNNATIEGYQPSKIDNGAEINPAIDLKNIVISKLGDKVIDESNDTTTELSLESLQKESGGKVDLSDGYHVYLVNGEDENIKFITIVYKDATFCHGMAYYDTENNIVADTTDNLYPILVAQIRLSENDFSYYLEPMKSVK
ncbi:MAG TPA: hypothetical protein DIU30_07945 [Clostridiales bacterium]|nr:hypothetical protein [Clostridium sp.]HCQ56253.1 hypothetical protein [Clostridiales bacterium]